MLPHDGSLGFEANIFSAPHILDAWSRPELGDNKTTLDFISLNPSTKRLFFLLFQDTLAIDNNSVWCHSHLQDQLQCVSQISEDTWGPLYHKQFQQELWLDLWWRGKGYNTDRVTKNQIRNVKKGFTHLYPYGTPLLGILSLELNIKDFDRPGIGIEEQIFKHRCRCYESLPTAASTWKI